MPDLRISELATLAGADLATGDFVPVADVSASESKKITVTDFVGRATTLIADATIPSGKILFGAGSISGSSLQNGAVGSAQLGDNAITAAKLADFSTVNFISTLPAIGDFSGQLAVDVATLATYCWNGNTWQSIKGAGSVNTIIGGTTGLVNITVVRTGDSVTINTTLDNTSAAAQFLAGPSGSAGAASYRIITASDLPIAGSASRGAVSVNGNGLALSGDQIRINNTVAAVTALYYLVQYDANGLITAGRAITAADLPAASSGTIGGVYPGSGLTVTTGGQLNHSNTVVSGTYTKVTVDAQGHVTTGNSLSATDIPEISTDKLTSGEFPTARIANKAITGAKLADSSTTLIGGASNTTGVVSFPVAQFTGQNFFDAINKDLYLWDGNAWQAITITAGEIIYAGTFDASTGSGKGLIASVTTAGQSIGLTVGANLPAASATNSRYYLVVSKGGTISSGEAPNVALSPPDMILSNGTSWQEIDVSSAVTGATQASNITFTPTGGIQAVNVQTALVELDNEKIGAAGATITGELLIGTTGALAFEGSTANAYETYLAAVDPTADRTITFPDISGTVITSADTGTVTNTMLAGSIAFTKLATLNSANLIIGNASNQAAAVAITGDITMSNAGVVGLTAGAIINADINANADIAFSKLTALNSGAILIGNASNVAAGVAVTGDISITNAGVTAITSGVIVNADVNATAAIAGSKINPDFGAQPVTTTGSVSDGAGNLRQIPQNAKTAAYTLIATDTGKHISITTGGVTIPASIFSIGDAITIYNNSTSSQTLTQGVSVTLRKGGTATTGNITLAQYGVATILCVASNVFVVTGAGVS
jgi:hypothetical protein